MSDAEFQGGAEIGQFTEDLAERLVGDLSDAEAVFWYGVYSLILTATYVVLAGNTGDIFVRYSGVGGFSSKYLFYFPAAMAWLAVSLFDSPFMRKIFKEVIAVSLMSPFYAQWKAYALYVYSFSDAVLAGTVLVGDLIGLPLWAFVTLLESVIQILLVPKIFNWAA